VGWKSAQREVDERISSKGSLEVESEVFEICPALAELLILHLRDRSHAVVVRRVQRSHALIGDGCDHSRAATTFSFTRSRIERVALWHLPSLGLA
jgi:hypothetical protein